MNFQFYDPYELTILVFILFSCRRCPWHLNAGPHSPRLSSRPLQGLQPLRRRSILWSPDPAAPRHRPQSPSQSPSSFPAAASTTTAATAHSFRSQPWSWESSRRRLCNWKLSPERHQRRWEGGSRWDDGGRRRWPSGNDKRTGTRRRRRKASEAETAPNALHARTTQRAGTGFRQDTLSGYIYERGTGDADRECSVSAR